MVFNCRQAAIRVDSVGKGIALAAREMRAEIKEELKKEMEAADKKEWQKKMTEEWHATKRKKVKTEVKKEIVNEHYRMLTQWKEKAA